MSSLEHCRTGVAGLERLPKSTMAMIGSEMLQEKNWNRRGCLDIEKRRGRKDGKGRKNEGKNEPSPLPEAEGEEPGRGAGRPLVVAARQRRGPGSAPARPSAPLEFPPRAGVGNVSGLAHPAGQGQAPGAPRLLSPGPAATPARVPCLMLSCSTTARKNPSSTAGLILQANAT